MIISIIDYGMGNLHSVYKAFKRVGAKVRVINTPSGIEEYDKIILPGVGDFKMGMNNLKAAGFIESIKKQVLDNKVPILGICLGMQLLTSYSEEGDVDGLDLINAKTIHFKNLGIPADLKIPHIGWNNINNCSQTGLLNGCEYEMVYFVHSYAVVCNDPSNVICETDYGITFHSGIQKENIYGLQFHPEKSHKAGLRILKNFINLENS
jgi:imidazole glycerol-phosphate synthase subunit HisH